MKHQDANDVGRAKYAQAQGPVMFVTGRPAVRTVLAALLSPLTPGALLLVVSLFGTVSEGFWAFRLSAFVGYPSMLILGLPVHVILKYKKWTGLRTYMLAGLLVGVAVYAVLFSSVVINNFHFTSDTEKSLLPSAVTLSLVAFFAVLSATVFWEIARPDR
jgi:hypothetical protein